MYIQVGIFKNLFWQWYFMRLAICPERVKTKCERSRPSLMTMNSLDSLSIKFIFNSAVWIDNFDNMCIKKYLLRKKGGVEVSLLVRLLPQTHSQHIVKNRAGPETGTRVPQHQLTSSQILSVSIFSVPPATALGDLEQLDLPLTFPLSQC